MRILHLTDHYLPVLGGIETHVAELAERQAARGDDVSVLTSTAPSVDGWHSDDHGPVTVHRVGSVLEGARTDLASYDVVHAHLSVWAPFAAPLAAMTAHQGVPTVMTVHSLWNWLGPVPAAAAGLHGMLGAPIAWTAVSRVAAEQVQRRLPGRMPVAVLPNAVEVSPRHRTPPERAGAPVRLVTTMRVARRKRPLPLVRMLRRLVACTSREVTLTIIGDGPQRHRLEARLFRAGLRDTVRLTGRLDPQQLRRELAEADIYLAPAVLESFGLAALEARCVGLPVVGFSASGLSEFVTSGREGWLCGSDDEMVSRLRWLVEDASARRAISEHNRTTPTTITWATSLEQHAHSYAVAGSLLAGTSWRSQRAAPVRGV